MVGDSEVDFATAAAAGIPSIGVSFGYTPVPVRELEPTAMIDHYREFMAALEEVIGGGQTPRHHGREGPLGSPRGV